jgi:hypothetical protein
MRRASLPPNRRLPPWQNRDARPARFQRIALAAAKPVRSPK